jgi:hypothetical protein
LEQSPLQPFAAYYIYIKGSEGWYEELEAGMHPYSMDQMVKGLDDDKRYQLFMQNLLSPKRFPQYGKPRQPIRDVPLY